MVVIHVDSFDDNCKILIFQNKLSATILPEEKNQDGFYEFIIWKKINNMLVFQKVSNI